MSQGTIGVILVISCTIIEGFAQICLKKSALKRPGSGGWIATAIILFITEALLYTEALRSLQVSIAYPIGSLSFVAVALLSQGLLGERITKTRWVGVVFIIAGASLMAARA